MSSKISIRQTYASFGGERFATGDRSAGPSAAKGPGNVVPLASAESECRLARETVATLPRGAVDELWLGTATSVLPDELNGGLLNRRAGALCVVRVADYRVLKETFGPEIGQRLRGLLGLRLQAAVRASDLIAQLGEDEFALVLEGVTKPEIVADMAKRLLSSCQGVYAVERLRLHIRASIGVARYPTDGATPAELVRWARLALHAGESQRGAQYQLFSKGLIEGLRERVWLAAELEEALAKDRFVLHYQPLFAMDTQKTIGAEALLRLRSSEGELVAPNRFIPLAEEMGLIVPVGAWVIREACQQLARWQRQGFPSMRMAINVSPKQLADPGFVGVVTDAVGRAGIEHRDLVLEITEGEVVQNLPMVERAFGELSSRGVQIAVDDFGTGYSALAYLTRLPLQAIKIDRSFLSAIPADGKVRRIVAAIIAMAGELGLEVTAEGVETEAQYRFLAEAGCHLGQGFGFARPQSVADFARYLQTPPPWGGGADEVDTNGA